MKDSQAAWLGAWLIALQFLGIPGSWKGTLVLLTGSVILIVFGIRFYSRRWKGGGPREEQGSDTYRESAPARGEPQSGDTA